mgnify:CR=1|jgi:hypothetical protein
MIRNPAVVVRPGPQMGSALSSASLGRKNVLPRVVSPPMRVAPQPLFHTNNVPMTQSITSKRPQQSPHTANGFTTVYIGDTPELHERITITYTETPPPTKRLSVGKPLSIEDNGFSFGPMFAGTMASSQRKSIERVRSPPSMLPPLPPQTLQTLANVHIPTQTKTLMTSRALSPTTSRLLSPVSIPMLSS